MKIIFTFFLLIITWAPWNARSWSRHDLLTQAALENIKELSQKTFAATKIEDLIRDFDLKSLEAAGIKIPLDKSPTFGLKEFNRLIEIKTTYGFDYRMNEAVNKKLSALEVLSKYADEPDWGMDRELFGDNEFPDLWKPAYSMMGGRDGMTSQAFRHMYWPAFSLTHPLVTFKLPISQFFSSMGEAPKRAKLFSILAREAFRVQHDYWAFRFLANALHYIEDCSQPFHVSQTPSKIYILLPFLHLNLGGFSGFVAQVTNIVTYYHLTFEGYIGQLMATKSGQEFWEALADGNDSQKNLSQPGDWSKTVENVAEFANSFSDTAGRSSYNFFPLIAEKYVSLKADDLTQASNADFWAPVIERGKGESKEKVEYFSMVKELFSILGRTVRSMISKELKPGVQEI